MQISFVTPSLASPSTSLVALFFLFFLHFFPPRELKERPHYVGWNLKRLLTSLLDGFTAQTYKRDALGAQLHTCLAIISSPFLALFSFLFAPFYSSTML
jgi:hypothetical protein